MATANQAPASPQLLITPRDALRIVAAGALVGLVTIALYYLLDRYIFTPTLCGEAAAAVGRCENKAQFSGGMAMVLGALSGLLAMVQLRVFRPLLVVLLVTVGLWNVMGMIATLPWLGALLASALLFGLAYAAFAWLAQLRNFVVAVVCSVVVVLLLRLVIQL